MTEELPEDPYELARSFLSSSIENGRFVAPKRDPSVAAFKDKLALKILPDGSFDISIWQAIELVEAAKKSKKIAEYARYVAGTNLWKNKQLPQPLKLFVALCLLGWQPKGKRGRKLIDNFDRDMKLNYVVDVLVRRCGLRATKNEASSTLSACDVVSEVLADLGLKLSYDRIADIYKSRQELEARYALDPIKEIVRLLNGEY